MELAAAEEQHKKQMQSQVNCVCVCAYNVCISLHLFSCSPSPPPSLPSSLLQSEKLASLESDYNKRQSELEQLQKDLEHQVHCICTLHVHTQQRCAITMTLQYQHIEEEKKKIAEEQVELKAMIEKERETLISLQT